MTLQGKLVVLTRTESGNRAWTPYLQAQGTRVYCLPAIQTIPLSLGPQASAALGQAASFDWLVLTSAAGARYLFRTLAGLTDVPSLKAGVQIAAIGPQTAHVLQTVGLVAAFVPSRPDSRTLGAELPLAPGQRVLLPRTTIASGELAETLRTRGGTVTAVPLYQTRTLDTPDEQFAQALQTRSVDYLTFASPSAVQGFCKRVTEPYFSTARELPAVAIGPTVAAALSQHGFHSVYTSNAPSITGIIEILQQLARQSRDDLV